MNSVDAHMGKLMKIAIPRLAFPPPVEIVKGRATSSSLARGTKYHPHHLIIPRRSNYLVASSEKMRKTEAIDGNETRLLFRSHGNEEARLSGLGLTD